MISIHLSILELSIHIQINPSIYLSREATCTMKPMTASTRAFATRASPKSRGVNKNERRPSGKPPRSKAWSHHSIPSCDFKTICSMLSLSSLQSWSIDYLEFEKLDSGHIQIQKMRLEKREVIQLTIGCWTVGDSSLTGLLSSLLDCLHSHGVEEINMEKVVCEGESSLDGLSSLLSIPTLQSWTIDKLQMGGQEPWKHLAKAAGQGSIKSLIVGTSSRYQRVKNWMKEEVEAVKISIAFLHFDLGVYCETDEEVKTLCRVLGVAKEWRVYGLLLPDRMGAEGWEALSKVADKGKVDFVRVSKSALRAANNQQVEALWRATVES